MNARRVIGPTTSFFDGTQEPDRDALRACYEGEFAGLRTQITRYRPVVMGLQIKGRIFFGERHVGRFTRIVSRQRPRIYHDDLYLKRCVRGRGFAREFGAHVEAHYRAAGVRDIVLEAAGSRGGYYWATQGYQLDDDPRWAAANLWYRPHSARDRALRLVRQGYLTKDEMEALDQRFDASETEDGAGLEAPITTVAQIVEIGRERPWLTAAGERMWIGKYVLLSTRWEAIKHLD